MKQKLFLTSEGIQPNLRKDFLSLLTKPMDESRVLFITTATYAECDEWKIVGDDDRLTYNF